MNQNNPIICERSEHNISRRDIDADALKVLYRLTRKGYIAYLVGGGVRDLLLERQPKDFDVSTDASPNQIRKLFRNCFLIGRRFRLAHIKYGNKIIETSTFRRQPEAAENGELLQLNDNEFGNPEEDARRRDFTINGLYYNVENFTVIDYVGGLEDLKLRTIRAIGDPEIRFQEDPVRMLRAIRFAARLDFSIEKNTYMAICNYAKEIKKASAPRMLEEIFRLFAFSSGEKAVKLLYKTSLLQIISPEINKCIKNTGETNKEILLWKYLEALDRGDFVNTKSENTVILAALFFPAMLARINKPDSAITQKSLLESFSYIVDPFLQRYKVPRRIKERLVKVLTMQHRFMVKGRKNFSKSRFVSLDWFVDALALHEIHLTATGKDFSRADEWRKLWEDKLEEIENNFSAKTSSSTKNKNSRKRKKRPNWRNKKSNKRNSKTSLNKATLDNKNSFTKNVDKHGKSTEAANKNKITEPKPAKNEIRQELKSLNKSQPLTAFSIMKQLTSKEKN